MTFIVFFQLIVAMHLILSSFPDLCFACFPGDSRRLGCSGGSALQNLVRTETFSPSTQYFVDPQLGNDSNSGLSPSAAFQSIQRAQLAVRNSTSSLGNGGVTGGGVAVNLLPGLYTLLKSPVVFSSADSGTRAEPIVYRGIGRPPPNVDVSHNFSPEPASEGQVVVSAGVHIPAASFKPWSKYSSSRLMFSPSSTSAAAPVYEVDLSSVGISLSDLGQMAAMGLNSCNHSKLELYYKGKTMTLARWPNTLPNGRLQFARALRPAPSQPNAFIYNGTRPLRWTNDTRAWLLGYFTAEWSDVLGEISSVTAMPDGTSLVSVSNSTPIGSAHTLAALSRWGENAEHLVPRDVTPGARFLVMNSVAELDAEGEYFVDQDSGLLLFIPPADTHSGEVRIDDSAFVSLGDFAFVFDNVSNMNVTGVTFQHSRQAALQASGVSNVWVVNCSASCNAGNGIMIKRSFSSGIIGCHVHDVGCTGIAVTGGDVESLAEGGNAALANHIHHFALWKRTYNPALLWAGVGNIYALNDVHDGPHNGFLGGGNEGGGVGCIFEYNTFRELAFETADVGAFYSCGQSGTGWANPANVVRHNSFRDITRFDGIYDTTALVSSVYLDDQMSFYVVSNNSFNNVQQGIEIGGGRSNVITGNQFNATYRVLYMDARGTTWQKERCTQPNGDLWQGLESVHYDQAPWSAAFPYLMNISSELPCVPAQTRFTHNSFCNSTPGSSWYVLWSCFYNHASSCSDLNTTEASILWDSIFDDNTDACDLGDMN